MYLYLIHKIDRLSTISRILSLTLIICILLNSENVYIFFEEVNETKVKDDTNEFIMIMFFEKSLKIYRGIPKCFKFYTNVYFFLCYQFIDLIIKHITKLMVYKSGHQILRCGDAND